MHTVEQLDALVSMGAAKSWRVVDTRQTGIRTDRGRITLAAGYELEIPGCLQRLTAAGVAEFYANELELRA